MGNCLTCGANDQLLAAVKANDYKVVDTILTKHSMLVRWGFARNETVLHWAAYHGNVDIINLVWRKGCDMNAKTDQGRNALHWAASGSSMPAFHLLIAKAVDLECVDVDGISVMHVAAEYGNIDVVKYMLDRGTNVNTATKAGWNAVQFASEEGHPSVVKLLRDRGAVMPAPKQAPKQEEYNSMF